MRMSISTTSGRSSRAVSIAWRPSLRLGHDLDVRLGVEDHPEAVAHEGLVVGDHDPDRRRAHGAPMTSSGSRATTANPPPGRGPAVSSPP